MGASWVQKQILEDHPHADINVYVVWFNMLAGDSRQGWEGYLVPDPRASNLWDQKRLVSQTLGHDVEGASQPVWDAYLLYGPEATWGKEPPRPISRVPRSTRRGKSSRRMSYPFSTRGSKLTSQPRGMVTPSAASYTPPLTRCSSAPVLSRFLISLHPPTGRWSIKL